MVVAVDHLAGGLDVGESGLGDGFEVKSVQPDALSSSWWRMPQAAASMMDWLGVVVGMS